MDLRYPGSAMPRMLRRQEMAFLNAVLCRSRFRPLLPLRSLSTLATQRGREPALAL